MNSTLLFDPDAHQLTGPAGSLPIASTDELARRFLMLVEGQCLQDPVGAVAQKYGYCRQRYYQILEAFQEGGLPSSRPGPASRKAAAGSNPDSERSVG